MRCSGFVVLRTPLLPVDTLVEWAEGLRAWTSCAAADDVLEEALGADRHLVRTRLRRFVEQPEVKEAIALASPAMAEVLRDPEGERFRLAEGALARYLLRMIARPTPFGLMAGTSLGDVGPGTRLELAPRGEYRRRTGVEGATIAALSDALMRDAQIRAEVPFRPNPDIYELGGELRYFVATSSDAHSFRLNAVERSPLVDAAMARTKKGARVGQIANALATRSGDRSRSAALTDALIDARVLVSDLEVPVTGEDALADLAGALRQGGAACRRAMRSVERMRNVLKSIDASGLVPPANLATEAGDALARFPPAGAGAPLQADLLKPAPGLRLDPRMIAEVHAAILALHRISPRVHDAALEGFRIDFERRYGSRQVRLVDALDPEHGIGCPAAGAPDARQPSREACLLELLHRAWVGGERQLVLSSTDLDRLSPGEASPPLPDALAALVSLSATSESSLLRGDFHVVMHSVHGPSGARLLGRACRADPAIHAAVAAHLREEERLRPDAVFVEVVLLPKQRHRNVMGRPVLRGYELSFACRSGASRTRQIPLADVLIALKGDRIELRSARLGRELLPRISCALNWAHPEGHAITRLLGALQHQGVADGLRFDWGPFETAPFLPRLCFGRAVLSLARWRCPGARIAPGRADTPVAAFRTVQALRAELALPRYVSLDNGDTPLALDLDNPLCVDEMQRIARTRDAVQLTEMFPGPEDTCVRGPEGRYAHELLIPFVATKHPAASGSRSSATVASPNERARIPGTDWLYARLYAGAAATDRLLCDVVAPVLRRAVRSGAIDRWFFVRYADPEPHLRVRAHGPPRRLLAEVLPSITRSMKRELANGTAFRVQFDTYQREIERYGGLAGADIAERVFCLDSAAVVAFLGGRPSFAERQQLAVLGIDRMLRALGLGRPESAALIHSSRDALFREVLGESSHREHGARFRAERREIAELLARGYPARVRWRRAFEARDAGLARAALRLRALERKGQLETPLPAILTSYVHLHVNRLFPNNQRRSELGALDMLHRHYASQAKR
jgi:thiopeptide-type bacteriocin biosynthesis protein